MSADDGVILHDHICEWCPWSKSMGETVINEETMAVIKKILPSKTLNPKSGAKQPLVN